MDFGFGNRFGTVTFVQKVPQKKSYRQNPTEKSPPVDRPRKQIQSLPIATEGGFNISNIQPQTKNEQNVIDSVLDEMKHEYTRFNSNTNGELDVGDIPVLRARVAQSRFLRRNTRRRCRVEAVKSPSLESSSFLLALPLFAASRSANESYCVFSPIIERVPRRPIFRSR